MSALGSILSVFQSADPLDEARTANDLECALQAMIADAQANHEAVIADFSAKINAAREAYHERVASLRRKAETLLAARSAELAATGKTEIFRAFAAFADAPSKQTASAVTAAWNAHATATRALLGDEPDYRVLIAAAIDSGGGDVDVVGAEGFQFSLGGHDHVANALSPGVGAAEQERIYRAVEAAAARLKASSLKGDPERTRVMLGEAGRQRLQAALAAFDAKRIADERAASVAERAAYEASPEHQAWVAEKERREANLPRTTTSWGHPFPMSRVVVPANRG